MTSSPKAVLFAAAAITAATSSMAQPTSSTADPVQALSRKIDQMKADYERQINELREQQAKLLAQQPVARETPLPPGAIPAPQTTPVPPATSASQPEVVRAGDFPGSIKIPGTNTSFKVGGFARLDVVNDFGGGEFGAIGLTQLTPFNDTPASTRKGFYNMNARESRVYVKAQTATDRFGPVTAYVEGDFEGAGGTEAVTNSTAFRLRHAYVDVGPWLAGQTWSSLLDLPSLPETLDFSGGNGPLQGIRASQLRYTARWADGTQQFALAAENPEADVFGTVATTATAGVGPTNTQTLDKAPDITAKYTLSGTWGRMTLGALGRHLVFNNTGGAAVGGFTGASSVNTFAFVSQGRINTFGNDSFQYTVGGGDGIGRYIVGTVNNTGAVLENGKLHGIHQFAYSTSYTHVWAPGWRSNLIWGSIIADLPHPYVTIETPRRISALYANLIWSPIPASLVGLEFERSEVKNDATPTPTASNRGQNSRLQASFSYGF